MGQNRIRLYYHGMPDGIKIQKKYADSLSLPLIGQRTLDKLRASGYWTASFDSLTLSKGDSANLYFTSGEQFKFASVAIPGVQHQYSQDIHGVERFISNRLKFYEDHGYPFASLEIDSIRWNGDSLWVSLDFVPGMHITFDSLEIIPKNILNPVFVSNYLGLRYGTEYQESTVRDIPSKMANLPFIILKSAQVSYRYKKAKVVLQVEDRKVNVLDGVLGMVPDQEAGGVEVTGELNLELRNLFQTAKSLEVHWQQLRPETQQLQMSVVNPRLFHSPIDFGLGYYQIKQDTSFSNRSLNVSFSYELKSMFALSWGYENKLANNLGPDVSIAGDFSVDYYDIGFALKRFDDILYPKDGFGIWMTSRFGLKEFRSNVIRPDKSQYELEVRLSFLRRFAERSVIALKAQAAFLDNDQLFVNDLYRLGGLRSIRGFNEGEFFASKYVFGNFEWRYYLQSNSFFLLFADHAILEFNTVTNHFNDSPGSLGGGLQMNTKSGNFQVLYGLGRRKGERFSFDSSKIHFGYTALF